MNVDAQANHDTYIIQLVKRWNINWRCDSPNKDKVKEPGEEYVFPSRPPDEEFMERFGVPGGFKASLTKDQHGTEQQTGKGYIVVITEARHFSNKVFSESRYQAISPLNWKRLITLGKNGHPNAGLPGIHISGGVYPAWWGDYSKSEDIAQRKSIIFYDCCCTPEITKATHTTTSKK